MKQNITDLATALNRIEQRKWGLDLSIPPGGGAVRASVIVGAVTYSAQRIDAATAVQAAIEYHEQAQSDPVHGQPGSIQPLLDFDRS